MDPITLVIIAMGTLITAAWPWIVNFFSIRIIPWVRERISPALADAIADFLAFADRGVVMLRSGVKNTWKTFKRHVLGSKMEVRRIDATTANSKITTIVRDEHGKLIQSTTEEILNRDELLPEIRNELTRQASKTAKMDLKKAVEEKFCEQAKQAGMAMELTI
jgi:hypothetical protein